MQLTHEKESQKQQQALKEDVLHHMDETRKYKAKCEELKAENERFAQQLEKLCATHAPESNEDTQRTLSSTALGLFVSNVAPPPIDHLL